MTAHAKTQNLLRLSLPVTALVKNEANPNKMAAREFDLLIDNIERTGLTDPILVRPVDYQKVFEIAAKFDMPDLELVLTKEELKFRIVGGHHRLDAAAYLGLEEVPVTVIMDDAFDEDQERFQLVRMNMIRGKLDPQAFFDLYNSLAPAYSDEVLQDAFGFADEAEFRKLIDQTAKALPDKNLQKKFKEAAEEIKTIAAEIDTGRDAISGEGRFEVALGKLNVPFPLKITGHRGGSRELLVTAKCVGNLGLLLHVTPEGQFGRVTLHLLNLAKSGPIDSWLKDNAPASHDKAVETLGKAVVKSFRKTTKKDWYAI